MFAVVCGFVSIIEIYILKKYKNFYNKKLLLQIFALNIIFSIAVYSYYIGYSVECFKAIGLKITPNLLYFSCMSIAVAVCTLTYFLKKTEGNKSGQVFGNIETLDKVILMAAVVVAAIFRIAGFWWGDGATFHPDEGNVVRSPIEMAMNNTLMSENIFYPAQTSAKILSIAFKVYGIVCSAMDISYSSIDFYYIGRIYIAVISTAIVICVFFIGNQLKAHAGTIACVITAVFPPFVQMAHNITGDPIVAFLCCLAMLFGLEYLHQDDSFKWLAGMSITAAVAALEKWNGIVICGFIACIVIAKCCKGRKINYKMIIREGIIAVICVVLSIIFIAPNLLSRINEILENVFFIANGYEGDNSFIDNLVQYSVMFASHIGIIGVFLLIYGCHILLKLKNFDSIVLSVGLLTLIGMCAQNRAFIRWGYPFYLCFIIIIGIGASKLLEYRNIVVYAVFALVIINNTAGSFLVDIGYTNSKKDTRVVSEEWFKNNGIRIEDCIYDYYTCWYPGGLSKYKIDLNDAGVESLIDTNQQYTSIKRLGRRFAVLSEGQSKTDSLDGITEVIRFEANDKIDSYAMFKYNSVSLKIIELYSIYTSLKQCNDIIRGNTYIGRDIYVYDISKVPVSETFDAGLFDTEITEEGKLVYSEKIPSISEGYYNVAVSDATFSEGTMLFENEDGELITQLTLLGLGKETIEMDKHYYNVTCRIIIDGEESFSSITINNNDYVQPR